MFVQLVVATQTARNEAMGIEGAVDFARFVFNIHEVQYYFEDTITIEGEPQECTQVSIFDQIFVVLIPFNNFKEMHRHFNVNYNNEIND